MHIFIADQCTNVDKAVILKTLIILTVLIDFVVRRGKF